MSCEIHPALVVLNGGICPICRPATGPVPFRVLVADPPWPFDDKLPGEGRGAVKHYGLMTLVDIERLALPPLADDCHLFLWRVSSMVEEAYAVARAWGFTPKSELVWRKTTKTGKRHFGMGRHVRAEHETCIIAVRGRPKVIDRSTRSVFDAPEVDLEEFDSPESSVLTAEASRVHSRKPLEFYALVERLCPGPRVELFARAARPGWTCLGNEVPGAATTIATRGTAPESGA